MKSLKWFSDVARIGDIISRWPDCEGVKQEHKQETTMFPGGTVFTFVLFLVHKTVETFMCEMTKCFFIDKSREKSFSLSNDAVCQKYSHADSKFAVNCFSY